MFKQAFQNYTDVPLSLMGGRLARCSRGRSRSPRRRFPASADPAILALALGAGGLADASDRSLRPRTSEIASTLETSIALNKNQSSHQFNVVRIPDPSRPQIQRCHC